MIIDLKLDGWRAVVVGGGAEARKRVRSLSGQGCEIIVVADRVDPGIERMAGAIRVKRARIRGAGPVMRMKPDIVIAATDDARLNEEIVGAARRLGALAYRSDDQAGSDFANPSIIDMGGAVQAAIFTGGRSPAMSKRIRIKAEAALRDIITAEDIARIRVQDHARRAAKKAISSPAMRKRYLRGVLEDETIDRLIKDGRLAQARRRAVRMIGEAK